MTEHPIDETSMQVAYQDVTEVAQPVCGGAVDWCRCILPPHVLREPHKCECGGSWRWEGEDFVTVALPDMSRVYTPDREDVGDGGKW